MFSNFPHEPKGDLHTFRTSQGLKLLPPPLTHLPLAKEKIKSLSSMSYPNDPDSISASLLSQTVKGFACLSLICYLKKSPCPGFSVTIIFSFSLLRLLLFIL